MTAVQYAHLVGKYVRMEREPTEVEWREAKAGMDDVPADYKVGAEGTVAAVWDSSYREGGPCVEVMMDYEMAWPVFPDERWTFYVADTAETLHGIWNLPTAPIPRST